MSDERRARSPMNKRYDLTEDFWSRVQGIPCQIRVVQYNPGCAGDSPGMGPPMSYADIQAPEPEEIEYEIYDRKGYRAKWLEDKMTDTDEKQIYDDFRRLKKEESQWD